MDGPVRRPARQQPVVEFRGATGTSCSDTTHSVAFLSTDLIDLKMAPTGTPTDHINVSWLVKFVPS